MDVTEAITTRIEVREYRDDPVDPEIKRGVLEAGRLASSGRNVEHWRFILIDDPGDLNRLGDLSPTGGWVADAAFAVVICTDPSLPFHELDAGRALTHMQLSAWEAGVGSCIYTVDNPALEEFLEIPDTHELSVVIGFGVPRRTIRGRKSRRPLSELAFAGRFGEPFSTTEANS